MSQACWNHSTSVSHGMKYVAEPTATLQTSAVVANAPSAVDALKDPAKADHFLNCALTNIPRSDNLILDTSSAMVLEAAVAIGMFNIENRARRSLDAAALPRNTFLARSARRGALACLCKQCLDASPGRRVCLRGGDLATLWSVSRWLWNAACPAVRLQSLQSNTGTPQYVLPAARQTSASRYAIISHCLKSVGIFNKP